MTKLACLGDPNALIGRTVTAVAQFDAADALIVRLSDGTLFAAETAYDDGVAIMEYPNDIRVSPAAMCLLGLMSEDPEQRATSGCEQCIATAAFPRTTIRRERKGDHEHWTLWVNGANAGSLVVRLAESAVLDALALGLLEAAMESEGER